MSTPDSGESPLETRVERLERGQSSIIEKLDQLIGGKPVTRDQAEADTERHLDRPGNIAEQVRAELQRAEQEKARADADAAKEDKMETLAQRVAALTEVRPDPPQPRRQMVMWGKR